MQFSQSGYSNYGQPSTFTAPYQFNGYPEVVGEGNVTSVMSPDGSTQLLFLPTTQWCRSYPCNINAGNLINPNWIPTGAWFIRSVFSPIQSTPCQLQPFQVPNGQFPRTYSSDCCVNQRASQPPNFELKFHNDICTSTSDIQYFYPTLRAGDWLKKPIGCASVQVNVPVLTRQTPMHYEAISTEPFNCTPIDSYENTSKVRCSCGKISDTSLSDMSWETDTSERDSGNHKTKTRKEKRKKKKMTSCKVTCECSEQKTTKDTRSKNIEFKGPDKTDKCVTTYADQACSTEEKGRETQTVSKSILVRKESEVFEGKKDAQPKIRNPKTATSKKAMKKKSSEKFKHCNCCYSSSHSDADCD